MERTSAHFTAAYADQSQRTRTPRPMPGSGKDAASASTAPRSAPESRRHDSIVTSVWERAVLSPAQLIQRYREALADFEAGTAAGE